MAINPTWQATLAPDDASVLAPATAWALHRERRVQLIDLRSSGRGDLPRIPGARVITLEELPRELVTLDHDRPVAFISVTGRKAHGAMKILRAAGMNACAVEGGIRAWLADGLPTENAA